MSLASKYKNLPLKIIFILFSFILGVYVIPTVFVKRLDVSIKKDTKAAEFNFKTGYYIGNGRTSSISGLGFTPDFVIIKSTTSNTAAVFKTTAMPVSNMAYFSATFDNRDTRLTLDGDGFTVSEADQFKLDGDGFSLRNSGNINIPNVKYIWIAYGGSDCESSSSYFCVGTYTGTIASSQNIQIGFEPDFVMVKRNTNVGAHFKTSSMGSNTNTLWFTAAVASTSTYIDSLNSDGFTVGSADNANGGTFYYVAFREVEGFSFKQGTYDGNSSDNTVIDTVGFKPNMVIVKNGTNATAASTAPFINTTHSFGNSSSYLGAATADLVDMIKGLESTGFKLGTDVKVNMSSNTYYYVAFGGATSSPGSGTFRMAEGSYVGNGGLQSIEDIGFAPDLVLIKNSANQVAVFRTKLMALDSTGYISTATANVYGGILSLNENSFDVGASLLTNATGNTYHWQAFGGAYDPVDGSGASDFAIGAYYGNARDDRDVTNLPFKPDVVVVKSITNAGAAVLRTSSHSGDISSFFMGTNDASNIIQKFNDDGFQVGTAAQVNTSAIVYFWFAFKAGDNVRYGDYTGNTPSSQTINIDAENGFSSDLIWTVPSNNVGGIIKPSTLDDPSSQFFLNTADATNQITAITENGFSVGAGTGANGAVTIRYVAWRKPYVAPPTNLPGIPGTPSFSNTSVTSTVVSWSASSSADYYIVERAGDRSGSPGLYRYVGTTSGTSLSDGALNANQKYWYRIKASNPNGYSSYSEINSVTTTKQDLKIQTGYYIGNGDQFSITGLGFAPELVIVKSNTASISGMFKSSTMRDNVMGFFSATADGAVANLNLENVRYQWIAFAGSDCSADGYFCLGAYTGTGVAQAIDTGFQPTYVSVKNNEAASANYKVASLGSNTTTLFYINTARNTTNTFIQSLDTTGFSVGTSNSVAGGTFHYWAFRDKANFFKQASYSGNSTDNTEITDVGFKPDVVIVKNGSNATNNSTYGFLNSRETYGNSSSYLSATADLINMVKGLTDQGFKLGTDVKVNATGDTYYYLAFGGVPSASGSGTFRMAQGSYTGNGTTQNITATGFNFKPNLVFVKSNAARLQVYRTSLMAGNTTGYLGATTAFFADGIIALNDGSFDIGGSTTVNNNGEVYHWQAFGNAYNPLTNTGASDFAIGAYYGSATDNDRNIVNLPFDPDFVATKRYSTSTNSAAVFRTSNHTGELSSYFLGTVDQADHIQSFLTKGFQVGANATSNNAATVHFWFAFKQGEKFKVGSYPGSASAQSIVVAEGFRPNLVWTKNTGAVGAVAKTSTLADPASQYFLGTANANTQITAINDDGFSVGTSTGANGNGLNFWYVAWGIPEYLISISVSDGLIEYGVMEPFSSKTTLPSDISPAGDVQRVTNNSSSSVNINIKGQNSVGSCIWQLGSINGYNEYKHQFCNSSVDSCTSPPSNYKDLTTAYQRLSSSLAKDASVDFHLRLVMPTSSSCLETQDVSVTVQASEI